MEVYTNDLGLYSYYTALAIGGKDTPDDIIEKAGYCAALVDVMGSYTPDLPKTREQEEEVKREQNIGLTSLRVYVLTVHTRQIITWT